MPSVERISPSGALRITSSTPDGHLFTRLYFGHTKREALKLFREELRNA